MQSKEERKEYEKAYRKSHKEQKKISHKDWRNNNKDKIKEYNKKQEELYKSRIKETKKQYYQNNKDKINKNTKYYKQQPAGKLTIARHKAKRREFQFNPLNLVFDNSNAHHLDKINVIHIPSKLHKTFMHRQSDNKSMKQINIKAWDFMESQSY